jgi:deoxyribose-phosphate aldolase
MTEREKEAMVARLAGVLGNGHGVSPSDADLHRALQRMVGVGACRFGVRADSREPAAVDACALAPPLARLIDHTVLRPETDEARIRELCQEARDNCFASVCVNPTWVPLAADLLRGATPVVCTVIGFPLGANRAAVKAFETEQAVREGALEIDMVVNVGLIKSRQYDAVEADIRGVVKASGPALVKVIIETALLDDEEKVIACVLAQNAGADFVKTSTGFSTGGATAADVALMNRAVGGKLGVKASGGIRSAEDVQQMVASGATRVGASASVAIVKGLSGGEGY